ncbi:MAG: Elongation factor P [Candidatus Giovannonibacteria bacterium GW2011_GWA2_53_7]|uniref:Elongation factor P n=1 Tax=Candidatus Giovannonibacteria bacterium GW2011_GWA2_53_7 TaxID=1618650 RepID=A0A0G1Y1Z9_9BACT|nr:MAG: Elongation factor P [Candidatus Giovannonibacteria bacterium GW2011_GWA2_53_7]
MLSYSEILPRKVILVDDQPYEVISAHVFRKQKAKPQNATKLKHVISGKVIEYSFHATDKAEEADIGSRDVKYIYTNRGEHWFCDPKKPADRFVLSDEQVGDSIRFIIPNTILTGMMFNDEIFTLRYPVKVELKVKESAPAVKGNTSSGALKQATLETGASVMVPLFINEGDIVRINTENGEYAERVEKA